MAETKAQIVISARDDTAGALAKAKAGFANLQQEAAGIATSFAAANAAIAALLGGVGIAQFVKNVASGLDALNDLRDATGASIENISGLEDVAARTGASFDTVSQSLVKFNQALSSAKQGSDAEKVIKAIGLSVSELKRLDPAEALQQTAKALNQFTDDGNKARAVQELFGKSLKEVAPFLKDLAEAGKLNATVTREQAAEAEKFNNLLASLSKNSTDTGRAIVSDLLPQVNSLLERFNKAHKEGTLLKDVLVGIATFSPAGLLAGQVISATQSSELERLQNILVGLQNVQSRDPGNESNNRRIERIQQQIDQLQKLSNLQSQFKPGLGVNPAGLFKSLGDVTGGVKGISEFQKYLDRLNEAQIATLDLTAEEQAQYDIAIGKLGQLNKLQEQQIMSAARGLDLLKQTSEVGPQIPLAELQRRNEAQKEVERLISQTAQGQLNELTKQYGNLNEALSNGSITSQQYVDALDIIDQKFGDLTKGAEAAQQQISEFAKQAARNIQDAVGDTVLATLEGRFDSIAELWGNLVKKLIAEALAAKLNEALFGNLLGGTGQGTGLIGDLFGGFFANGGYLEPGKLGVVGERGPELIMAGSSGTTVTPMASGPSVNVTYSIGQIGSGVSRAEVVAGMNAVREQTRGEFMQMLRKRGVA